VPGIKPLYLIGAINSSSSSKSSFNTHEILYFYFIEGASLQENELIS